MQFIYKHNSDSNELNHLIERKLEIVLFNTIRNKHLKELFEVEETFDTNNE
jgi:hypothetical protein